MVVKMKKLTGTMLSSDRKRLMKLLVRLGVVEIVETDTADIGCGFDDSVALEIFTSKKARVSFALGIIDESRKKYKNLLKAAKSDEEYKPIKYKKPLLTVEQFEAIADKEEELLLVISELEELNRRQLDNRSDAIKLDGLIEKLRPYSSIEEELSRFCDTRTTAVILGSVPILSLDEVRQYASEHSGVIIEEYPIGERETVLQPICVICSKSERSTVTGELALLGFSKASFDFEASPSRKFSEYSSEKETIKAQATALLKEILTKESYESELFCLYDYYDMELQKLRESQKFLTTASTFSFTGWLPSTSVKDLEEAIQQEEFICELSFEEPKEDEIPPSYTKNNYFVNAFGDITDMFGAPSYKERDPNIFVAFFYFLMFGIMISDAGYGIVMALACFLVVKLTKPKKNSGRMLLMFGFSGISTIIWGALFGGWFGITPDASSFLGRLTWFSPLDEPLKMFSLSLGVGMLQIGCGFALKGLAIMKEGGVVNFFKGLLNQFGWVVIFLGLFCIAPNFLVFLGAISFENGSPHWFSVAGTVGLYVCIVGLVMLLVGGGVGKKNPIKMVGGALGNLYGGINVMSDLLSYTRLFGLGLATGVIGYVVNLLGDIIVNNFFGGNALGWIAAVPILLVGHVFNLAINLLGAYVHDSRLQYIEFFGRFYEGTGRAFIPLGTKTRFVYLDNEKIK